jgi:hypothetical protein
MPEEECDRVFKKIMPELSSVCELVMAERKSKEAREYMERSVLDEEDETPWNVDAEVSFPKYPCIYVKNAKDTKILFPRGFDSFLLSIIPDHRRDESLLAHEYLGRYRDEAIGILQEVLAGKESLYSLHDNLTALELLDVSNDETELWHMWSANLKNIRRCSRESNTFPNSAGVGLNKMGHVINMERDKLKGWLSHDRIEIWISHDRKILLMCIGFSYYTCIGTRSRSIHLLNWTRHLNKRAISSRRVQARANNRRGAKQNVHY